MLNVIKCISVSKAYSQQWEHMSSSNNIMRLELRTLAMVHKKKPGAAAITAIYTRITKRKYEIYVMNKYLYPEGILYSSTCARSHNFVSKNYPHVGPAENLCRNAAIKDTVKK